MTKLRKDDIVTLQAVVISVAPYDRPEERDGQQIMVKLLPAGDQVGWLLQHETAFTPSKLAFRMGDEIWLDKPSSTRGKVLQAYRDETDQQQLLSTICGSDKHLVAVPMEKNLPIIETYFSSAVMTIGLYEKLITHRGGRLVAVITEDGIWDPEGNQFEDDVS